MSGKFSTAVLVVRRFVTTAYHIIRDITQSAERHHIFLLASGITFNTILFMLPSVLAMTFVFGLMTDAGELVSALEAFIQIILPPTASTSEILRIVAAELEVVLDKSVSIGWLSIPALFWLASTLFGSLRTGLNGVLEIQGSGTFLIYKLKDLALLLIFTVLVFLTSIGSAISSLALSIGSEYVPQQFQGVVAQGIRLGISILISLSFFLFLYTFVPNKRLPRFVLLVSVILSTTLWESARYIFAWYVSNVASYGKFYGAYAVIVVSAIWLYYSSFIILFSAEVARYWHIRRGDRFKSAQAYNIT